MLEGTPMFPVQLRQVLRSSYLHVLSARQKRFRVQGFEPKNDENSMSWGTREA